MKYLNLGCGSRYSIEKEWTNLDFVSTGEEVIGHNLLSGIPFGDNTFDLVYHSHLLEHFSKDDGRKFLTECFRVLVPGGIIRIVVPDLERIARNYIHYLEAGLQNSQDKTIMANYDWMLLELYDQTVRNYSGGNMAKYLFQDNIKNEDFVFERIGVEGRSLRNYFLQSKVKSTSNTNDKPDLLTSPSIISLLKVRIKKYFIKRLNIDEKALAIGKFRLGGEVHQWMYDRYSLYNLLRDNGGNNIKERDAFTSFNNNWAGYNIDGSEGVVRKPDSLFMEANK